MTPEHIYGLLGHMKTASVSELKNSLSAHLQAVQDGEPCVVTDHRKPIAILQPIRSGSLPPELGALVASGVVTTTGKRLNVKAFLQKPKARTGAPLTSAILEERYER